MFFDLDTQQANRTIFRGVRNLNGRYEKTSVIYCFMELDRRGPGSGLVLSALKLGKDLLFDVSDNRPLPESLLMQAF